MGPNGAKIAANGRGSAMKARRVRNVWRPVIAAAAVAAMMTAMAGIGVAEAGRYASSKSPYWRVGQLDPQLSAACRKGEFNQRRDLRLFIGYNGPDGKAWTGVAKREWNLKDRRGLAVSGVTYHFFDDGYSTCKIYVAGP